MLFFIKFDFFNCIVHRITQEETNELNNFKLLNFKNERKKGKLIH